MRVTLIAAQSVDGFITRHEEPGTAFTSAADQRWFAAALDGFDCSVCGSRTYRQNRDRIRRHLVPTGRRRIVMSRQPEAYAGDAVPRALEFTADPPRPLLARLATDGLRECALLGGGEIHQLFLEAGCVDRIWLTLEPRLFGAGTPLVAGRTDVHLALESVEQLPASDSLLVRYTIRR